MSAVRGNARTGHATCCAEAMCVDFIAVSRRIAPLS